MEVSPFLYAIQSLKGQSPSEKKKELHCISQRIIENNDEYLEFIESNKTERVQSALVPHLRALIVRKSRLNNVIIEGLKSNDIRIFNQALKAKWFFVSSNSLICADYFRINIFPFVTSSKRRKLIRTLAHCLKNEPYKSKDFFEMLIKDYDTQLAQNFLIGINERDVYDTILLHKLNLTEKVLENLYQKYPKVAVRYLQLGNFKKTGNKHDREIHNIHLPKYEYFLPKLVKRHTSEFIQMYDCLGKSEIKLGVRLAKSFIENATIILITQPHKFLDLLPLKTVTKLLSPRHFKTMFENLLPQNVKDFDIKKVAEYLQYYPQDKKMDLLEAKYHLLYNSEVYRNASVVGTAAFYELFSKQLKDKYRRQMIKLYSDKKNVKDVQPCKLPPKISLPMLKKEISQATSSENVIQSLESMVISCAIYDSNQDLLEVLQYYRSNHISQPAEVLLNFFNNLTDKFFVTTLSKAHWLILRELILWAHERGDFQDADIDDLEALFKAALYYHLNLCFQANVEGEEKEEEEDRIFFEKLVAMTIQNFLEYGNTISFVYASKDKKNQEISKYCLEKFLTAIPKNYPIDHTVWDERRNKINITVYLVISMLEHNSLYFPNRKKRFTNEDLENYSELLTISDYPWLASFCKELMKIKPSFSNGFEEFMLICNFRESLQNFDPKFFESIIDEDPDSIYDVIYAKSILRRKPIQILNKWELYLSALKKSFLLEHTKLFIAATKWHHDIPVKFVQQCLTDVADDRNSIKILKILLEKDEFHKLHKNNYYAKAINQ